MQGAKRTSKKTGESRFFYGTKIGWGYMVGALRLPTLRYDTDTTI